eukprot:scaffold1954_cov268-Pinguiococcus_pyrenoidosus.AAC.138
MRSQPRVCESADKLRSRRNTPEECFGRRMLPAYLQLDSPLQAKRGAQHVLGSQLVLSDEDLGPKGWIPLVLHRICGGELLQRDRLLLLLHVIAPGADRCPLRWGPLPCRSRGGTAAVGRSLGA